MKEGAIIHRNGVNFVLRSQRPKFNLGRIIGFSLAQITGASPCTVSRLPCYKAAKRDLCESR